MEKTLQKSNSFLYNTRQKKILRLVSLTVMVLMFCAVCFLFLYSEIYTDVITFSGAAVGLLAMLFTFIVFLLGSFGKNNYSRKDILFLALVMATYFLNFFYTCALTLSIKYELSLLVQIYYTLNYVSVAVIWILFWFFLLEYLPSSKVNSLGTIFVVMFSVIYIFLALTNPHTNIFYTIENGYVRFSQNKFVSASFYLFFNLVFLLFILGSKGTRRTKWSLSSYVVVPLCAAIVSLVSSYNDVHLIFDVSGLMLVLPLYLIFFNNYIEQSREYYRQKSENVKMETALMLSQIQPHFLYNSLATISGLCYMENATRSKEAVEKFADYLRLNLDSIKSEKKVPFEKSLEHTKTYLWLEKMRFSDELNIEYDIEFSKFLIPPLIVQPLVENAVKHGICAKEGGGTVKISTKQVDDTAVITVSDDGAGFDVNQKLDDGKSHIGIENIRKRIETLCGGTLDISSVVGEGTTAVITLPLGEKQI